MGLNENVNGEVVETTTPGQALKNLTPAPLPKAGEGEVKGEAGVSTTTPVYMTEDQVKALLKSEREEIERTIQSRTDKTSSRIEKVVQAKLGEVEASLKLLEGLGQTITPEIRERIRQKIVVDAMAQPPAEETPSPPAPLPKAGEGGKTEETPGMHPVMEQSMQILRGMGLDPATLSDEAVALIDQETKDAEAFLKSIRKAAAFEVNRLGAVNAPSGTGIGNAARVASFGAQNGRRGNPIEHVNDPDELFKMAFANG